ncbi:hypothetical protein CAEBREN_29037 [Caenorhabditis brenneri]|uniref:Uncharacterized protein n=1 Tax=Caenorhabditis brenneri TaxID=135651 RepID=G0NXW5_CAEBE|nr:hypothetical protein CAEBREN_29037 [Caenorhabditis brenneri]
MTTKWTRNGFWLLPLIFICVNSEILEDKPPKFQVLRAHAEDVSQLKALRDIQEKTQHELDFWQTPSKVGHRADIMVDVDRMTWLDSYGFGEYHSYQTICDWMKDIERKYPDRAKVFTMGTTAEGRPIQGIKIGSQVWRNDKRIFWIDGGIHAREWAAVHTTLWFIDRLIADYNDDALVRSAVDRLNFYILPVANPDGYEYSRSDVSPMIRLWRKNRAGVVCKKDRWFRDRCCGGVDLNRNYDWHFGETGSSTDKCSEIYQGSSAFSELETRSMRDFLTSPELNGKIDAFITLHTYSQMWIHPYSHARKSVPADVAELQRVGRAAVAALENTFGTKYKFGTGSDILYPSAGGSDDWAKGTLRIKYVYLLELRPGEDVWDGFILDQHQLIPTAKETWNGIKVVIRAVSDQAGSLPESIASTLPPITLPPPPPETTTTTTVAPTTTTTEWTTTPWTTTPWTTTPWTTTPWTTTPWTTTVPFSSIFIITEPAPITRTTPTHLDAFYKLGKRRFKFVSIKTFLPTLPTTPMPASSSAFTTFSPPTFPEFPQQASSSFISQSPLPSLPFVTVVGPNENNNQVIDDFEGASPRVLPAFVRRPNGSVVRTQNPQPTRGTCVDRSSWCASWLSANSRVCQISAIYMRQDCARTCGFC